jgi:HSP20 family protein
MMSSRIPYDRRGNTEFAPFQLNNFIDDPRFQNFGFSSYFPWGTIKADVKDLGNELLVEAELPGAKDKINIDVEEGVLTISVNGEEAQDEANGRYVYRERRGGTVSRSFTLNNISEDEIRAEYRDGILSVHLPKADKSRKNTRKIDIH